MKARIFTTIILVLLMVSSCTDDLFWGSEKPKSQHEGIKIAVVSDIHYMDPSLLKNGAENGEAFQNYLNADPKLIEFSDPIFRQVMLELKVERPDIVLVAGDLTKDGEKVSHETMTGLLKQLKDYGMKVYVVPGNHDILNPEARSYDGDNATPTPSITPEEFGTMYSNFGYASAISRDPNSLSYVVQPASDLWILALDDCKYLENTHGIAVVGGNIRPETMQWAIGRLEMARQKNITVLGLMHHNLIEHYAGQSELDPGYVTDNWVANTDALMNAGLNVIFTGHYHANDITMLEKNGKTLYDIETGSLVSPPIPYRITTLKNKELDINTNHVTSIAASMPGGLDFVTYGDLFFSAHLDGAFSYILTQPPFSLDESLAANSAPLFRDAYKAHFAGDEKISPAQKAADNALAQTSPICGMVLSSFWTDLNPKDNKWHIKITNP